jgi:hypothetical protein
MKKQGAWGDANAKGLKKIARTPALKVSARERESASVKTKKGVPSFGE